MRLIYGILNFMEQKADIFSRYSDIQRYVDGATLSVDPNYRSHGIATQMFQRLIELCKEKELPVLKVFCSSLYTAKLCERLGMTKVYETPFADVKLDGLPPFDVWEPHTFARNYSIDLRK